MSRPDKRADTILSTPTHIAMKGLRMLQIRAPYRNAASAILKSKRHVF
jgi:hypothetical protein